jgi:hypothetical protein
VDDTEAEGGVCWDSLELPQNPEAHTHILLPNHSTSEKHTAILLALVLTCPAASSLIHPHSSFYDLEP